MFSPVYCKPFIKNGCAAGLESTRMCSAAPLILMRQHKAQTQRDEKDTNGPFLWETAPNCAIPYGLLYTCRVCVCLCAHFKYIRTVRAVFPLGLGSLILCFLLGKESTDTRKRLKRATKRKTPLGLRRITAPNTHSRQLFEFVRFKGFVCLLACLFVCCLPSTLLRVACCESVPCAPTKPFH